MFENKIRHRLGSIFDQGCRDQIPRRDPSLSFGLRRRHPFGFVSWWNKWFRHALRNTPYAMRYAWYKGTVWCMLRFFTEWLAVSFFFYILLFSNLGSTEIPEITLRHVTAFCSHWDGAFWRLEFNAVLRFFQWFYFRCFLSRSSSKWVNNLHSLGTFLSMVISSTNGTLTPFFAHMCNLDPAKIAGPLETAFQVKKERKITDQM